MGDDSTGRAAYLAGWTKPLRRAADYRKSNLRQRNAAAVRGLWGRPTLGARSVGVEVRGPMDQELPVAGGVAANLEPCGQKERATLAADKTRGDREAG